MPAPLLAAPLVIPFAEAIGVSIAALGMSKATDKVNEFIQENPEQSMKIFQMIMPSQGIANALKNKSSEGDEEVSEDIDVEVEEKPKKLTGREKGMRIKEAIRRARAGRGNYSSPDAEGSAVDIRGSVIREVEDMGIADKDLKDNYDPTKPKFDYKKFFKKRYADGGAIGIEVLLEEENPRQGLFMGGSPLTGQALSIYNSMNAYGFDDKAIADALAAQGLYTPVSSTPVVEEPVTNIAPNIINQGGDGGITNFSGGPTGSSFFGGLNKNDYEADAYGIGPTFSGSFARTKQGLTNFASALKNIPTPINLARMAYESYQQKQIEKRAQEEAIARDIARDMQESNRAGKTGGYQAGYDRDFMDGPSGGGGGGNSGGTGSAGRGGASPGSAGPGGSDSMGSFARGGLAAMFKKKR